MVTYQAHGNLLVEMLPHPPISYPKHLLGSYVRQEPLVIRKAYAATSVAWSRSFVRSLDADFRETSGLFTIDFCIIFAAEFKVYFSGAWRENDWMSECWL